MKKALVMFLGLMVFGPANLEAKKLDDLKGLKKVVGKNVDVELVWIEHPLVVRTYMGGKILNVTHNNITMRVRYFNWEHLTKGANVTLSYIVELDKKGILEMSKDGAIVTFKNKHILSVYSFRSTVLKVLSFWLLPEIKYYYKQSKIQDVREITISGP